jgi:hypothetical protein
MKLLKISVAGVAALGLLSVAGCANTAQNAFVGAEASDSGALAALSIYKSTGKADPGVVAKMLADQATVDTYLTPDEAAIKAGQPLTNTSGLTTAIAVLVSDAAAAGILNGSK